MEDCLGAAWGHVYAKNVCHQSSVRGREQMYRQYQQADFMTVSASGQLWHNRKGILKQQLSI